MIPSFYTHRRIFALRLYYVTFDYRWIYQRKLINVSETYKKLAVSFSM